MIFVDTGAWAAVVWGRDANHRVAEDWLAKNDRELLTTNYIVSELLTLLRSRGASNLAVAIGNRLFNSEVASVHHVTPEEQLLAWNVFRGFDDKEWSFTDCTSKVVMERLGITSAFTFDHHFKQFGNVQVVPG